MPFERWSERIDAAADERSRRELLAEIGRWRAARLTDIPALREAAFAMSRLYALLGEHDAAAREAKSLVSLAQTPPIALDAELAAARAWLEALGEKAVLVGHAARRTDDKRSRRPAKKPRPDRPSPKQTGRDSTTRLAAAGRYDEALTSLEGARGPRAALTRTWLRLAGALDLPDAEQREAALRELESRLRARLLPPTPEPAPPRAQAAPAAPEPATTDHPLAALVDAPVPVKWKPRLHLLETWYAAHPDQGDDLAALALDHHVAKSGPKSPAPWLIGLVGQALAGGEAPRTREVLARLAEEGAYAVTAYDEAPFAWLVEVLRAGRERGWSDISLRRGVSSRGEPRGRRIWTLRYTEDGVERQIAATAPEEEPYPSEVAPRIVERLPALCARSVLLAPGPGNAPLREAALALGVSVAESPEPEGLLAAAGEATPVVVEPDAPPPAAPTPPATPGAPAGESLVVLRTLLSADEPPSEEAILEVLATLGRLHPAFQVALEALEALDPADRSPRVLSFLRAAHRAAPEHAHLPEGITLAVRTVVAGGGEARDALVDAPTASRYGGVGVEVVLELATALAKDGWAVDRVLRGPTARERRNAPVLQVLDDAGEGIWRMILSGDGARAEVWHLAGLTPEGRAAVPQLLDDRPRVVVLSDDDDLVSWFSSLGVDAVRWAGTGEAVRAAVGHPAQRGANT